MIHSKLFFHTAVNKTMFSWLTSESLAVHGIVRLYCYSNRDKSLSVYCRALKRQYVMMVTMQVCLLHITFTCIRQLLKYIALLISNVSTIYC